MRTMLRSRLSIVMCVVAGLSLVLLGTAAYQGFLGRDLAATVYLDIPEDGYMNTLTFTTYIRDAVPDDSFILGFQTPSGMISVISTDPVTDNSQLKLSNSPGSTTSSSSLINTTTPVILTGSRMDLMEAFGKERRQYLEDDLPSGVRVVPTTLRIAFH